MARRVKQSDGSYCYTENCRIHDRSGGSDSIGLAAVTDDAMQTHYRALTANAQQAIQEEHKLPAETAKKVAEKVMAEVRKSESVTAADLARFIDTAVVEEGVPAGPSMSWDTLNAATSIHNNMIRSLSFKKGDEVILKETGERGTITEGGPFGPFRFNPENTNSRNSFAWFRSEELTRLAADDDSPTREKILALPRDNYIPKGFIKKLMDEETSKDVSNAQGIKEFGRKGRFAREVLCQYGEEWENTYGDKGITRQHLVSILTKKYHSPPVETKTEAETRAVKSGLRNIINYLERVK